MKKVFYVIFVVVIATTLVSNLDWRLGDYGYHSISLDSKVMAQTTSTTGGGGGDTPTPPTPLAKDIHPKTKIVKWTLQEMLKPN